MTWGGVLAYFYFSGRLAAYLHPTFHIWTLVAGVTLILLSLVLVFGGGEGCAEKGCHHHHEREPLGRTVFSALLLTIPLVGAAVISPGQFGATAVLNRGLVDSIADLPSFSPPMEPPLPGTDGSASGETNPFLYLAKNDKGQIKIEAVDLLYAAREPTMREDFENKEVEVTGQFLPASSGNPNGDRFNLVRMFVMCCAADARPVAVAVKTATPETFPEMTWLKVTGRAVFPIENGRPTALILADSVTEVEPPNESFFTP